jgi:hypothetical protein
MVAFNSKTKVVTRKAHVGSIFDFFGLKISISNKNLRK